MIDAIIEPAAPPAEQFRQERQAIISRHIDEIADAQQKWHKFDDDGIAIVEQIRIYREQIVENVIKDWNDRERDKDLTWLF